MNIKYRHGVKYSQEFVIYGRYGDTWESVYFATSRQEAESILKDYKDNEEYTQFKIISRWVKYE